MPICFTGYGFGYDDIVVHGDLDAPNFIALGVGLLRLSLGYLIVMLLNTVFGFFLFSLQYLESIVMLCTLLMFYLCI